MNKNLLDDAYNKINSIYITSNDLYFIDILDYGNVIDCLNRVYALERKVDQLENILLKLIEGDNKIDL